MTKGHIRLNLRALEQYVVVAEERHFHHAARRLNMSQPPLTYAIRRLEETLGVVLIERGQQVIGLTTAGQTFLEEAKRTLEQATHAVSVTRDMAAGRTGTVSLGMALPLHHPLAGGHGPTLESLADEPFILWPMLEGRGFHLQVFRLCANAGFVPTVVQEAHGMHAVLSLVAAEVGVSIVPESMQGFRSDRIHYCPIPGPESVFALVLAARQTTPAAEAFLQAARPY